MDKIIVTKMNEVYFRISCEKSTERELSEYFKFRVPGYQFMPSFRNKLWDGYIRLFSMYEGTLYVGLLPYLEKFALDRNYILEKAHDIGDSVNNLTLNESSAFYNDLKLPFEARDYQVSALSHAITRGRSLLISPTGSGKSAIIYGILRKYMKKTLLVVPTTSLVEQMHSDFENYSAKDKKFDVEKMCHKIYEGQDKQSKKLIHISTWQSLYKLPKAYFEQFEVVMVDEAHLAKAKSLTSILEKCTKAKYRFGTTGTLDGMQTNKLVLEGLLGEAFQVTTTKQLMDKDQLAELRINCVVLQYDEASRKQSKDMTYQTELEFLISNTRRNKFIARLALSMTTNTLVTFQYIEGHGKILYELIKEKADPKRKVFFVSGEMKAEDRELVRRITEREKDAIIVASVGVFSTGINIRNLDNIIFASPSKSRVRVLQSIGRVLRKGDNQNYAVLYDIVDDLAWKSHKNFAIKHFVERLHIYVKEKFNYKLAKIKLYPNAIGSTGATDKGT